MAADATTYSNFIQQTQVVVDTASENLIPKSVWINHVMREELPLGVTQTKEVTKDGELERTVLPENTQAPISEFTQTSTLLNAIKSVVVSRSTVEGQDFGRQDPMSKLGMEQAKALAKGADEDIASLVSGFSQSLTAAGANLTALELLACAFALQVSTNGHVDDEGGAMFIGSPKQIMEATVVDALNPASGVLSTIYGNAGSSFGMAVDDLATSKPGARGFHSNLAGLDLYKTNVVDDDGTNFRGCVFQKTRAFVGFWSTGVNVLTDLDLLFFRNEIGTYWYFDAAIHWDEAGCQVLSPI